MVMRVGVLALQGGFSAHLRALEAAGHEGYPVRYVADLERAEGLILPGGESTAQWRLLAGSGLAASLDRRVQEGVPLLATCAGLILAAEKVAGSEPPRFGWLDISVERNAWGRQVDSFEARGELRDLPLIFIRAPRITRRGDTVEVLESFRGEPVLVRQGARVAATFHPELTVDRSVHLLAFGGARVGAPALSPV